MRWSKEQRYEIMDEEVAILKALWTADRGRRLDGKYYTLEEAELTPKPLPEALSEILSGRRLGAGGGALGEALRRASLLGRHRRADRRQHEGAAGARRQARARDELGFGMRLQIVCRENEKEAWEAADKLVRNVTAERTDSSRRYYRHSVANQRVQELARTMGDLIAPNLWTGLTKARPGAGICIVGNPEQCADVLQQYIDIGCHSFCLSGYLHDAEAERFHRMVRPILADRNRARMKAA